MALAAAATPARAQAGLTSSIAAVSLSAVKQPRAGMTPAAAALSFSQDVSPDSRRPAQVAVTTSWELAPGTTEQMQVVALPISTSGPFATRRPVTLSAGSVPRNVGTQLPVAQQTDTLALPGTIASSGAPALVRLRLIAY